LVDQAFLPLILILFGADMDDSSSTPHPGLVGEGANVQENRQGEGRVISRKHLINKLNLINFQDGTILINFFNPRFRQSYSRPAKPQPCVSDRLDCLWCDTEELQSDLLEFQVQNFIVRDEEKALMVIPLEAISIPHGISIWLPETCHEITSRRFHRNRCENIKVQLIQSGTVFQGTLIDFCPVTFTIELALSRPQTFHWINQEQPVTILLADSREMLYSGECRIIKQAGKQRKRTYVLELLPEQVKRVRSKRFRSGRYQLVPSPDLCFRHPFTGRTVSLKIVSLSGTGFAVEESEHLSVLLPGMVMPEAKLSFASSFKIPCRVQVIHKSARREKYGKSIVQVGLAILDMSIRDHLSLLGLLHQANNEQSYINNEVDLDSLWNFFFETGFIYPQKYAYLQARKEQLKETYRKIYTEHPDIARHFIYQEHGNILGHVAMLRFYNNAWMIHHHAARKSVQMRAGLMVLDQIGQFTNDAHGLHSFHMGYLLCFFRPENRFPQRVFGGAVKSINDPGGCSIDSFAYFHFHQQPTGAWDLLPKPWSLTETLPSDLLDLKGFYELNSGGLMLQALDLEPELLDQSELSKEYERIGLSRARHLFSLKNGGRLQAIIVLNHSDVGLNLSDLTNCLQIFVIHPELPKEIVNLTLSLLSLKFSHEETTVLLFPRSYAEAQGFPSEKTYNLWVLNTQYSDPYFDHIQKMINVVELPRSRK
jgi:hypothetical protein